MTDHRPMTDGAVDDEGGLKREFTLWSAGALAFAFISPIVALYSIFAFAFTSGGPAGWWGFAIVLAAQLVVALVFGEMASRWPYEGSVYQWSRRLRGTAYGWFTGWAYMWTLVIAVAAVSYGAAGFVPPVLDIDPFSPGEQLLVAIVLLAVVTLVNTAGRRWMKALVIASLCAELIGSIGIGTVLLLFHNEHPLSAIFHTSGAGAGPGGYVWSGMFAAVAFIGWSFVGFESAGSIAEEVKDPRRAVPKAMIVSLLVVAAVVMYAALALILAIPDYGAVLAGDVADPVTETIATQLGSGITRPLFGLFIIGFMATLVAVEASASRVMWSLARDGGLPASARLTRLSGGDRLPVNAIVMSGVLAAVILVTTQSDTIYLTLVNFTTGGFYLAFGLPLVALAIERLRGGWEAGPFTLGRKGTALTVVAAIWIVFQLVNIAWPRATELPWYQEYGVVVMMVVVGALGGLVYAVRRRHIDTTASDTLAVAVADEPVPVTA
jgi:amino acid transporter